MTAVYLSIGSNLGDRATNLQSAVTALSELKDVSNLRLSTIIETAPIGGPKQPDYLNAVIECEYSNTAYQLLKCIREIEKQGKRQRLGLNHPRTIDIDILLFGDESHDTDDLAIPHPRMHQREFVLRPLSEFLPEYCANVTAEI